MNGRVATGLKPERCVRGRLALASVALIVSVLAMLVIANGVAQASSVWTVNTTSDLEDGYCGATCSIRDAIASAASGDEIDIPAGDYVLNLGDLLITKSLLISGAGARNTTIDGNGNSRVFTIGGDSSTDVTIAYMRITGGNGTGSLDNNGVGGGIYQQQGQLTLQNVSLDNNSATTSGGGLDSNGASTTINFSLVADNSVMGTLPEIGGGIDTMYGGQTNIFASTIADNSAVNDGGGIAASDNTVLGNDTIVRNSSANGPAGGLSWAGTPWIGDTIVALNTAGGSPGDCDAPTASDGGNNLSSDDSCQFTTSDLPGVTDPKLGLVGDNGGPTDTVALLSGSPAVGAGDPSTCTGLDQRGVAHPADSCDIGAYQSTGLGGEDSLAVQESGTGSGTVTSAPAGVDCGSTCYASFDDGTTVTLTATPAGGSTFTGWSGGDCAGTGTCVVALSTDTTVTATFDSTGGGGGGGGGGGSYQLTVNPGGAGAGTVTSSPAGIDCGSACTADFDAGTAVTLSASANTDSTFTGWSGACSGTGPCSVTMNSDATVGASFGSAPTGTATATTGAAHMVAARTATVTGLVDPNGTDARYWFQYGPSASYGSQTAGDDAGTDNGFVGEADLTGLSPGTTYHYRIVAQQGSDAPAYGADRTFTTLGPLLSSISVGSITLTGASVSVDVNPAGSDTQVSVEYGTDDAYGAATGSVGVPVASGTSTVALPLTGLKPGTTYHFVVVATNSDGTTTSTDQTLTTTSCPSCAAPAVSSVSQTLADTRSAADIAATIDPRGVDTQVVLEWGTSTSYQNHSAPVTVSAGGPQTLHFPITGLAGAQQYHYAVVATNPIGQSSSGDLTFTATCAECGIPLVSQQKVEWAPDNGGSHVAVYMVVDPHGFDTQVSVTVGIQGQVMSIPAGQGPTPVQLSFSNASPDLYSYSVKNAAGTVSAGPTVITGACTAAAPSFVTAPTVDATATAATITASITAQGEVSANAFYYEASGSAEQNQETQPVPATPVGSISSHQQTVTIRLDGLKPGTHYIYWLAAVGCVTTLSHHWTLVTSATTTPSSAAVIGGAATVPIQCSTAAPCSGSATLELVGLGSKLAHTQARSSRTTILGRVRFTIRPHRKSKIHVRLSTAGERLLHKRHRLSATLRLHFTPHGKRAYTVTDPITLVDHAAGVRRSLGLPRRVTITSWPAATTSIQ